MEGGDGWFRFTVITRTARPAHLPTKSAFSSFSPIFWPFWLDNDQNIGHTFDLASCVAVSKSLLVRNLEFKFLFFFLHSSYRSTAALAAPLLGRLVCDLVDVGGEEVGLGAELLPGGQQHPLGGHLSLPLQPLPLSLCPTNFFVLPQLQGRMAASRALIGRGDAARALIG